jgi:hypothetical protein
VTTTFKAVITLPAAALAIVALASCGGGGDTNAGSDAKGGNAAAGADVAVGSVLFPDNFKGVCSGAGVATATAYDPAATTHKALYFATYRDDLSDRSHSLPDGWTVRFSPNGDALRAVDLVVCARRTAAREVRVCSGFRSNGRETQNRVRWHTATYELSVREARTGRELAKTTAEATNADCPMFQTFNGESETVDGYASLSDTAVADFLRPHVTREAGADGGNSASPTP